MEESLNTFALDKKYSTEEASRLNPLILAWIGDSVFSDLIRRYLIAQGNANINHLTHLSFKYVSAEAQAKMLHAIAPLLTEKEQDIVRRGRNTRSTPPKHADKMDYRYATGIEALFGFLSLTGEKKRIHELMSEGIPAIEKIQ